jgi:hypothetical protein
MRKLSSNARKIVGSSGVCGLKRHPSAKQPGSSAGAGGYDAAVARSAPSPAPSSVAGVRAVLWTRMAWVIGKITGPLCTEHGDHANSASSAFASLRSGVSKPSVNQP